MRRRGRPPHPDILTPREWEVLALLRDGRTNDEIADRLNVAPSTARFHVSEILGKLGVGSREAAARWRPDGDGGRRLGLLAPLPLLRRPHVAPVAGGAIGVAAIAGVALLAWGVMVSAGRGAAPHDVATPASAIHAWSVDPRDYGVASVMLFDVQRREARRLAMPSNVGFAEWLKPGETFIGYDVDGSSYNVYRVDGTVVRTLFAQHLPLDHYISKSPDGRYAIVTRVGGADLLDADTGQVVQSVPDAMGAAISPDGQHLAYVVTDPPYALPDAPHTMSLVVARRTIDRPTFDLPGRALVTETADKETFGLVYNPWSPDGRYVALLHMATTAPHGVEVFDLAGTRVWTSPDRGLVFAAWAGAHTLTAGGMAIDMTTGSETAAPSGACCGYSPDGRYAVRVQAGGQLCELVDATTGKTLAEFDANAADHVANFCSTISWTADSRFALVSRRGG